MAKTTPWTLHVSTRDVYLAAELSMACSRGSKMNAFITHYNLLDKQSQETGGSSLQKSSILLGVIEEPTAAAVVCCSYHGCKGKLLLL